jgi:hypothetical protein
MSNKQPTNQKSEDKRHFSEKRETQNQTSNVKSQTTKMETHAHHLHNAPGKNFWHYFYEFLMLFLAVFCGFLAENFREHQVEKERGRQYLHSLIEDLKNDTTQCSISIKELSESQKILDNLTNCFIVLRQNIRSTGCLREIILHSTGFKDFIYSDRTIQQLKNAGGLRLIQNKEIADSITSYDATVRECLFTSQYWKIFNKSVEMLTITWLILYTLANCM